MDKTISKSKHMPLFSTIVIIVTELMLVTQFIVTIIIIYVKSSNKVLIVVQSYGLLCNNLNVLFATFFK